MYFSTFPPDFQTHPIQFRSYSKLGLIFLNGVYDHLPLVINTWKLSKNLIDLQSDKSGCNGCTFNMFIVDE